MSSRSHLLARLALRGLLGLVLVGVDARAEPPAQAAEECAESLALRVQARYANVRDLRARFRQTTRSVALGGPAAAPEEARGEVVFAKPSRMRWTYESPEASMVVSDGQTLWVFDPAANEVQVLPVDEGFLSGTAVQFLLGRGRILDAFTVSTPACGGETADLVLVPRQEAAYEKLELRIDAASGEIRETEVFDLFGNRTRVAFEGARTNTDAPDALFRFEAPPGARVLRVPAPTDDAEAMGGERPPASQ